MIRRVSFFVLLSLMFTTAILAADPAPPPPPPPPPPPAKGDLVTVPVHYSDQAVVVSTKHGVAMFRFDGAAQQGEGQRYVYRFLPAGEQKEVRGEGSVFEKYERKPAQPPQRGFEVTDAGGRLELVAAQTVALKWSLGSETGGWLYFVPEDERVQLVSADDFEKLKLSRFAK